jgi:hypothetical protein
MANQDLYWLEHHNGDVGISHICNGFRSKDAGYLKKTKAIANLKKIANDIERSMGLANRAMEVKRVLRLMYDRHRDSGRLSLDRPRPNWATKFLTIDQADE